MADLKVRTGRVPHRQSTDQQAFDDLLDKTVRAPRLSGSKIKELSDSALRLVANDHHLVTSLLRLNTSLPTASTSRISSLYVFDAIARAAKSQVDKGNGRTPSTVRGQGTNAGLLAKMEGVVESWVAGMVDDGKGGVWSEGRVGTSRRKAPTACGIVVDTAAGQDKEDYRDLAQGIDLPRGVHLAAGAAHCRSRWRSRWPIKIR